MTHEVVPPTSAARVSACPPCAVPTLTEVLDWPGTTGASATLPAPACASAGAPAATGVAATAAAGAVPLSDEEIVDNVLAAVQSAFAEADGPLDQRLRDVIEPALARFADALVADIRADFAAALRDVAAEAVVRELDRYRRGDGSGQSRT